MTDDTNEVTNNSFKRRYQSKWWKNMPELLRAHDCVEYVAGHIGVMAMYGISRGFTTIPDACEEHTPAILRSLHNMNVSAEIIDRVMLSYNFTRQKS
jgi:hypothetical protein